MFDAGEDKDIMLSVHSRKPIHHLKTRTPEQNHSVPTNGNKTDRRFNKSVAPEYGVLRDGAINRSIEASNLHNKSTRESSQSKIAPSFGDGFPRGSGLREGEVKKRGRIKKGVLKREDSIPEDRVNHLQQRKELLNVYNGDAIKKDESSGRKKNQFKNIARDSSSLSDYTHASDRERADTLKRLTSANRPKSAGQTRFLTEHLSDSDDSFYDGEIEEVDLDDPVFAFEREFEEARAARLAKQDNRVMDVSDPLISYFDSGEQSKSRPQSDRNPDMFGERPSTSHRKRRVRSETEVSRISLIPRRVEKYKPKRDPYKDKRLSEPLVSEKLYTYSMDKVISKYSGLSVKRSGAHPKIGQDPPIPRGPLPRKLKPILRREKLGHHVSSPVQDTIDRDW